MKAKVPINSSIEMDPNTKEPIELHQIPNLFTLHINKLCLRIKLIIMQKKTLSSKHSIRLMSCSSHISHTHNKIITDNIINKRYLFVRIKNIKMKYSCSSRQTVAVRSHDCANIITMELSQIIVLVTTVIFLYFVYRHLFIINDYWRKNGIPCVDGAYPIIGHNWPLLRLRESYILLFYKFYKSIGNRSMIGYYNFSTPGLIIRDPELVKKVLLTGFNSFEKNTSSLDPHLDPLLTTNPFFTVGEEWKKNRTIVMNCLSSKKLKFIALQLQNVCRKFSNHIEKQITLNNGKYSVNIPQLLSRFTAEFVAIAAFGIDGKSFTEEPNTFESTVRSMFQPGSSEEFLQILVLFFPFLARITQRRFMPKQIDNYFRQIIKHVLEDRKRTENNPADFLQQISEFCQNENNKVDEAAVTSHAATFFLDGYITSAITMSFAAYQVAAHPTVQEKLRNEVTEILDKYNGEITYESIQEMKYMDQVLNESLRLFPALPYLAKICNKEFKLVGFDGLECNIQPGTEVIICTIGLHRDSSFWNNPDVFDPERFNDDKKNEQHKYVHLPFGSGPRICIGMRVAMMQMKAAFAALLKNYSIEVDPRTKEPIEVHPLSGLFAAPNNELWLCIKPFK